MKNRKIEKIEKELLALDVQSADCTISSEDFDITYGKKLSKNPTALKSFKTKMIKDFNETGSIPGLLMDIRIVAIANGMAELAKSVNIHRPNLYKTLTKNNNPRLANLKKIINNLGFDFKIISLQ
jgi:DNA-binding phage protein